MGTLEVVGVDEKREPPGQVRKVREDCAREKLFPQGFPEALDLAECLRVLGPALDVPDAFPPELLLEVCRATPRRVLAALVGEDLLRRAEGGDAVLEGFHDEAAFLVMRQGVPDDEARVVVHEGGQVHTLMLAKKKREDVRLPELVGLGSLESTLGMLPGPRRHPGFEKPFFVQDSSHLGLRDAQGFEARQDVTDTPRAVFGVLASHRAHGLMTRVGLSGWKRSFLSTCRAQSLDAHSPVVANPRAEGRRADAVRDSDVAVARPVA